MSKLITTVEKILVIDGLQNVLELLKDHSEACEIRLKAQEAVQVVDDKLAAVRSDLRELVHTFGELHIDLNGEIYVISKKESSGHDVVIEPFYIDCKRITAEV